MVIALFATACAAIVLIFDRFACKVPAWIPITVSIIGYLLCRRIYPMEEEPEKTEEEPGFKEYDIDGVFVTVSRRDRSLAYYKDGRVCSVAFSEIYRSQYDKTLLGVCEMLMHDGVLSAFEYIAEYVYQYDRDFAMPYISRYAVGEFTREELLKSRSVKTDSIVKTAKMFVGRASKQEEQ